MSLILHAVLVSDPGLIRANNEDSAYAGRRLLAVADGMGGMPAGDMASDIMIRWLAHLADPPEAPASPGQAPLESSGSPGDGVAGSMAVLLAAIEAANREIGEVAGADPAREGMGTTVTVVLFSDDQLALAHVGDSRAYLLRDGTLQQLTRDDTFVQGLVEQGLLTPEEARRHPQRSLVTQAVQGTPLEPQATALVPQAADRLLLCSDGLSDVVADTSIAETLRSHPDRQECADALVKLAVQAGAPDNVTVIVADLVAG